MQIIASPLRSGPWTWQAVRPADPGREDFDGVQLWHEALPLPVLDFVASAWALDAPEFAGDGLLRFDVVALANRARFRVTLELATGWWRSAGEPRGQPAAVLQQRFGGAMAVAPWPVVVAAPVPVVDPPEGAAGTDDRGGERTDAVPVLAAPAPPVAVAAHRAPIEPLPEPRPEPPSEEVLPPSLDSRDGRWRFEFAFAPVREEDASGRLRSYCSFVLHDLRTASVFDSRTTGDLCWPGGPLLRLVRGPKAPVWFLVDVDRAVFWLENFREPLGPERPLDELVATLTRA